MAQKEMHGHICGIGRRTTSSQKSTSKAMPADLIYLRPFIAGIFVYMSYGVWQSKEGDTLDESGCEEYLGLDEALEDERQEIVQQLQEEGHESDDGSSV